MVLKSKQKDKLKKLGLPLTLYKGRKAFPLQEKVLQNKFFNLSKAKSIDPDNAVSATESVAADLTSGLQKLYDFKQQAGKK